MTCLEWWGFEIMNFMSGRLGVAELAANAISFNYNGFIFMICVGIGIATGTMVGNSIGENNIENAKMYIKTGAGLTNSITLFVGMLMMIFRHFLATVFTKDTKVVNILENLIFFIALNSLFDSNQGALGKVLLAMGRQAYAARVNLMSYYVIMIPIGTTTAFYFGWGIYGIWLGILLALMGVCSGYIYIIYKSDWNEVRKVILEKVKH